MLFKIVIGRKDKAYILNAGLYEIDFLCGWDDRTSLMKTDGCQLTW